MRKIIAIGGEPGTGKTTLVRKFMEPLTWEAVEPVKLVSAMYCKDKDLYVLGKYEEGETFAGTDRLSMAVQPAVKEFVESTTSNILFEGDRVFNQSFLEFLSEQPNTELDIIFLVAEPDTLRARYADRGSDQSEVFLKGRKTKYENLLTNFTLMPYTMKFLNENEHDQNVVFKFISKLY
jgi:broad-specificity NMP kinase